MPADYQVIDPIGAWVWPTNPYSRLFWASQKGSPLLLLWVLTGYSSPGKEASIRINGTQIDTISPRPWTNHFVVNPEAIAVPFNGNLLNVPLVGIPFPNTLTVVTQSTNDYVYVDNVIFMSRP